MRNSIQSRNPERMTAKKPNKFVDFLLVLMMILPFAGCVALKVLFGNPGKGINVTGAQIYFRIRMPLQDMYITEGTAVSAAVVIALFALVMLITRGLKRDPDTKRQLVAEFIVEKCDAFVEDNMGRGFLGFSPFVAAIMALSAFSSLSSLLGLYPPTSDISIVAGWAVVSFAIITFYKLKGGAWNYFRGFFEPIPLFAPMNVISELSTPVSMAFRHYGNVLSGYVVSTLVAAALSSVSAALLRMLPGAVASFPLLRIGIPAVLSIYFDVFSGVMQAFIFAVLTILNVKNGFPEEEYERRLRKKQERRLEKEKKRRLSDGKNAA